MRFTKDHEWVVLQGDVATVGITAHAAEQLGDVVFVETPEVGKTVKAGDGLAVVESVKAASDVYAPISGEVVEANTELGDAPETVNAVPESGGGVRSAQARTYCAHSEGTWDSTPMRARTSSPRLVSWVDSVVIACGHIAARVAAR